MELVKTETWLVKVSVVSGVTEPCKVYTLVDRFTGAKISIPEYEMDFIVNLLKLTKFEGELLTNEYIKKQSKMVTSDGITFHPKTL